MQAAVRAGVGLVLGGFAATVTVGLSACGDIRRASFLPPVNPESPVATAVAEAARRSYPTPSFADVPPVPKDMPTAPAIKLAVIDMVRCRRMFERYDASHPPILGGTLAFAADERTKLDQNPKDVPTAADDAASLAYAASLRAYAAPPPPILSGPPPTPAEGMPPAPGAPSATAPPRPPAPPPAAPPPPPSATPAAAAPPARVAEVATLPQMPPPRHDPLLAHCP